MRSYQLGVNAYVVKPVEFHEFVNAVKELGIFWAVINEPPPGSMKGDREPATSDALAGGQSSRRGARARAS